MSKKESIACVDEHYRAAPPPPRCALRHWMQKDTDSTGDHLLAICQKRGGVVRMPGLLLKTFLISSPEAFKRILLDHQDNYPKLAHGYKRLSQLLGHGLLTVTDVSVWEKKRRLIQPWFQPRGLGRFAEITVALTDEMSHRWSLAARSGAHISVVEEMMGLLLRNALKALFSKDVTQAESVSLIKKLFICNEYNAYGQSTRFILPSVSNIKFHLSYRHLDRFIKAMVKERQQSSQRPDDLLTHLLYYRDPETGQAFDFQEVVDEVKTFLVTGHETTGNLLTWIFYLLDQNKVARANLYEALTAQPIDFSAIDSLQEIPYLTQVIQEALRLYPPIWNFGRVALKDDVLAGFRIPSRATLLVCPYTLQRNPKLWPHPNAFIPERFANWSSSGMSRYAYMPFGFGPRTCIASSMAMLVARIVVAKVVTRFSINLLRPLQVRPAFHTTLKPQSRVEASLQEYL